GELPDMVSAKTAEAGAEPAPNVGSTWPVVASTLARWATAAPSYVVKAPPTKRVLPESASGPANPCPAVWAKLGSRLPVVASSLMTAPIGVPRYTLNAPET